MTAPQSRPSGLLRRFSRSRSGNIATLFALSLPLVVGGAGFSVETGYWYLRDRQLQGAADAAAYAAALENRAGRSIAAIRATASAEAGRNGFATASGTITVNRAPTSGAWSGDVRAVEVLLSQQAPRYFTGLFLSDKVTLRTRAVAVFVDQGRACVVALSPTASRAAEFTGSSNVTLNGCSVLSNSVAADAVYVAGAGRVRTPCLYSVGGASVSGGATLTECAAPITDAPVTADPYAGLTEPADAACTANNTTVNTNQNRTLSPGVYCGGLNIKGTADLQPGVYVISGGDLSFGAQAVAKGSGVTFFFKNGAGYDSNGGAKLTFSAPTTAGGSNPYKGVLFFGSRTNTGVVKINGNSSSELTGAIYFPNQSLEWLGNFSGRNGCTHVVGRTVSWSGNSTLSVDCTAEGLDDMPAQQFVQLVE